MREPRSARLVEGCARLCQGHVVGARKLEGIVVVLALVLPIANRADLAFGPPVQRDVSTTRA